MKKVKLADAKARLSELVDHVQAGDTIALTRRGKAVACLVMANRPRKRIDRAMLRAFTDSLPPQPVSAVELVRTMRDSERA